MTRFDKLKTMDIKDVATELCVAISDHIEDCDQCPFTDRCGREHNGVLDYQRRCWNRMDDLIRRSDAIRIASGYCHWTNIPDELEKLPPVNPIQCEDAISRQAVEDAIYDYSRSCDVNYAQIMEYIDNLPSVSTEKTGHWEWVQYDSNPNIGNWHCSECNRIVCGAITAASPVYSYKFCPNCGAFLGGDD